MRHICFSVVETKLDKWSTMNSRPRKIQLTFYWDLVDIVDILQALPPFQPITNILHTRINKNHDVLKNIHMFFKGQSEKKM